MQYTAEICKQFTKNQTAPLKQCAWLLHRSGYVLYILCLTCEQAVRLTEFLSVIVNRYLGKVLQIGYFYNEFSYYIYKGMTFISSFSAGF